MTGRRGWLGVALAVALITTAGALGADDPATDQPDSAAPAGHYDEPGPETPQDPDSDGWHAGGRSGHEGEAMSEPQTPDRCPTGPRLSGTFIQPNLAAGWTVADWIDEFRVLQQACISEVAVQWTADSGSRTAVFPTNLAGFTHSLEQDLVGNALTAADVVGMQVYLGLQVNDEWWSTYTSSSDWLAGEAAVATSLLDDLAHRYGGRHSLAGWYVPFEVDNWHHPDRVNWQALSSFYAEVSRRVEARTPGSPVVVAPFFNPAGGLTPANWTRMWAVILSGGHIDVIALQDGVGAGHATADQLATWFAATRAAIDQAGVETELWADTETFTTDFQPMAVRDVVAHMAAVDGYVSRFWSFSYNHYQSPRQVGAHYHQAYLGYLATGTVD
jgi:hypothetical protein